MAVRKKPVKSKKNIKKLPSFWNLMKFSYSDVRKFWRPLASVLAVYGVLYFIFVMGFSLSLSWQQSLDLTGSKISQAASSVFSVFGSGALSGGAQSDAITLIQFLLFLIASLALVWSIRRLHSNKPVKIHDAYYGGNVSLVPTILVSFVLILTLLPAIVGSGIFATAAQYSPSSTEITIVGLIAGVSLLISLYFLSMIWPAFYIVSLPPTRPWQAIKSAAQITKKHRFAILRKIIYFAVFSFIALFIILFPGALLLAQIVPALAFMFLIVLFGFGHIYFYSLYKGLL